MWKLRWPYCMVINSYRYRNRISSKRDRAAAKYFTFKFSDSSITEYVKFIVVMHSYFRLFFWLLGFGQRHKTFQNIISIARERKFLLTTKARYAGIQSVHVLLGLFLPCTYHLSHLKCSDSNLLITCLCIQCHVQIETVFIIIECTF